MERFVLTNGWNTTLFCIAKVLDDQQIMKITYPPPAVCSATLLPQLKRVKKHFVPPTNGKGNVYSLPPTSYTFTCKKAGWNREFVSLSHLLI